jgi:Fe-S cluster assembly scaffold protein SufB
LAEIALKKKVEKPQIDKALLSHVGQNDTLHIARGRKQAYEDYLSQELPMRVGHVWKRARAERFVPEVSASLQMSDAFMASRQTGTRNDIQFLAGSDLFVTLDAEAERQGVEIKRLDESPVSPGQVVPSSRGFFEALNQSLWSTGIHIRVPAGVQLTSPIHIRSHLDARFPFVRTVLVLEENASATVLERIGSSSRKGRTVMVSEVDLHDGAILHHGLVADLALDDTLHYSHGCRLGNGATLNLVATSVGSGRLKADLSGELVGEGARSEIRTFGVVQDDTALDFHTRQHHVAAHTFSDMKSRSVLLDNGVSSNTGLIHIEADARNSEAFQIARNLMLSKDAEATSIPELEIENNDVTCSHGSATGPLNPEQLFYLQSRGLSKGAATRLIVEGSLDEILAGHPVEIQEAFQSAHESVFERLQTERAVGSL